MAAEESDTGREAPATEAEPLLLVDPAFVPAKAPPAPARRRRRRRASRAGRGGLWLFLVLMFGGILVAGVGLSLAGRSIPLPVWAVAEAETRLNRLFDAAVPGEADLSLGGASVTVGTDGTAEMTLTDLRLLQAGGEAVVTLPEVHVGFDALSVLSAAPKITRLRLVGPRIGLRRLPDGRLDLAFGSGLALQFDNVGELLDAADAIAARPALSELSLVEAEGLTLSLDDQRAGRKWDLGDGRMTVERRVDGLAADMGVTLLGGARAARATMTLLTDAASPAARLTARVEGVSAADLASQAAPLDWLRLLEATATGEVTTSLGADGRLVDLATRLEIGPGALRPGPDAAPVAFDRMGLSASFDAGRERLVIGGLTVEGPTLRLSASGTADLPGVSAGRPQEVLAQVVFDRLILDPDGVFEHPAEFTGGAADLRLRLDPFTLDLGQLVILDGDNRGVARGKVTAGPGGWTLAMDFGIDAIGSDRLLALWPLRLIGKTRAWFATNVQEGTLFDVKGALRVVPGQEPRMAMSYEFTGAGVRFLKTLPPVEGGQGYATLEGQSYLMVLDAGKVTAPLGGAVDVSRSVFAIADIYQRPARGELHLHSRGPLTATLSLLDEPPFRFLTKAGRPVDLGSGEAETEARINLPLGGKVTLDQVVWSMRGTVSGFASEVLVPGRRLEAPVLAVSGDGAALEIAGQGTLDAVPFEAVFRQPLGHGTDGRAEIRGTVELSAETNARLGLGLPKSMVSGLGSGEFTVTLARGAAPLLSLASGLKGLGLAIPELGWNKPRGSGGALAVEAELASPARVTRLALDAAGLVAEGTVSLRPGGGLERAVFDRVRLNGWLDAGVTLTGRSGQSPAVALTGGTIDLRRMAERGGAAGGRGTEMQVSLDRVRVSEGIALTGFSGRFSSRGGLDGEFTASVNGEARVSGRLSPGENGTSARLTSADGGKVLSAAGVFPNARGGSLDLTLKPRPAGGYTGAIRLANVRVRNVPALAELINAVSVVGLLDQLNGQGILFAEADARFLLTADGVELRDGAAVGASLGVSMAGVYRFGNGKLDMQGTISPLYLVNALGQVVSKRGEGLFGFSYRLTGTAEDPAVSVNPLSIITPGMFRDIFRRPVPRIEAKE